MYILVTIQRNWQQIDMLQILKIFRINQNQNRNYVVMKKSRKLKSVIYLEKSDQKYFKHLRIL